MERADPGTILSLHIRSIHELSLYPLIPQCTCLFVYNVYVHQLEDHPAVDSGTLCTWNLYSPQTFGYSFLLTFNVTMNVDVSDNTDNDCPSD